DCCARAANGQASAAPPMNVMNSRRRMSCLGRGPQSSTSSDDEGVCAAQRNIPTYVGSGSKREYLSASRMSAFIGCGHWREKQRICLATVGMPTISDAKRG